MQIVANHECKYINGGDQTVSSSTLLLAQQVVLGLIVDHALNVAQSRNNENMIPAEALIVGAADYRKDNRMA